ncbi:hypothetical protein BS50DRAFT_339636 [Corynespora cassiicola Philippines]|uniref:Uncharacterized protein n=1 Tax=Corynespora cassiicola Philippines TaxID=1448308 RepID=A0A2T2NVL6_CORCC|nr:hypothetical protein BS50DRAFT_339636 [Corynespora cassiicola Philippines]
MQHQPNPYPNPYAPQPFCRLHDTLYTSLLHLGRRRRLDNAGAVHESRPEDAVRVLEHAVLETDHNELRALEPRLDKTANVLRVRQVERSVHLVENVHGRRLELQQRQDE